MTVRVRNLIPLLLLASSLAFSQTDVEEKFFSDDTPQPTEAPSVTTDKPIELVPPKPEPPKAAELKPPRLNYTPVEKDISHPLFDWSKHKGEKQVPHPFAERGLVEISKEKVYFYKVQPSKQSKAATFHVGILNPTNLRNPDEENSASFKENYESSGNPAIMFDYEWQIWKMPIGKIGITAGSGIYFAQGHGHFVNPNGLVPKETFSLMVFPTSVGAIYRLAFWDRQLIVPHATGGITLLPFTEIRDDGYPPRFGGSAAAYFAAGFGLNLTYFDKLAAISMDRQYGINRVYLMGEFRQLITLSSRYDFSGPLINFGFTAEF